MLNDEFVAGLAGLVPAHLLRSHSLQCVCAWISIAVPLVGTVFEK